MRKFNSKLLHSASDLNAYLGCAHSVSLSLRKLLDPSCLPDQAVDGEDAKLIAEAGNEHEERYLQTLKAQADVAEIASDGPVEKRVKATIDAMRQGVPIIYQAAFLNEPWHGFADFLRRVDQPSRLCGWSYEPIDTKLAREPRAKHLVQLGLYADLLETVQGRRPERLHVVLGNGEEHSFATKDFSHTIAVSKSRYLDFVSSGARGTTGEPCGACKLCGWRDLCADEWERADHLCRVAGLSRPQAKKLQAAGITTLTALAEAPANSQVPKIASAMFAKLKAQADLQLRGTPENPIVELLPLEPERGFRRLPCPDPGDLFFDLEGDPLHEDGLEYLWGVHFRDDAGVSAFRHFWAHDREAERTAFEAVVDWFTDHVARYPNAHIYHYAAYEVTVLRRLSTAFASREDEVDSLLRREKFVDLYSIARRAIRTSERNMSLKTLEKFFAQKRQEDVKAAAESIVYYHRWLECHDADILESILDYNRVDCENTEGLRDWLVSLRPAELPWWTKPASPAPSEQQIERQQHREELRRAAHDCIVQSDCLPEPIRELLLQLVDFHKRAKKPALWAVFDRCDSEPHELVDDLECIGCIEPSGTDWLRPDKRSTIARYSFPPQETKLKVGADVLHAPTRTRIGKIFDMDASAGWIEVKKQLRADEEFPHDGSIIQAWPIDDTVLESALWRAAKDLASEDGTRAILDLLMRAPPRLVDWTDGDLVQAGESLIEAATRRSLSLDESLLFIQGPPGTGKTYTSAHVILALISAGKRVGVTSNSHKAINNLLRKIEELAAESGTTFDGIKKASSNDPDSYLNGSLIDDTDNNAIVELGGWDLIGGTAYLFARPEMATSVDYLFVDEAGQVSLGNMLAMGSATKNVVLVGDQMQLAQPIQGAHPGESGKSALEFFLQGEATIAPDKGILLDTSWRMHPSICTFISEAVYDGRLRAQDDCSRQQLLTDELANFAIRPHGISIVEMYHQGCSQSSEQEALAAKELINRLLGMEFIDREDRKGTIQLENILVVAPYNAQVNLLRARLPVGAQVGTVDKFQGQEAEVVIVSLATSTPEDLPRNVDFFYSKNRLNVAISRARTLALVLMNPRLLELDAVSVDDLGLVNTLAWARDYAERQGNSDGYAP